MKTQHLIGTALLATALLFSCKPNNEDEKYRLTVTTCSNIFHRPGQPYPAEASMIRLYKKTAYIRMDTVWIFEDGEHVGYRKIFTLPDNELVCQSSIIDTIHTVYVPSGEYILTCLYLPHYDTTGQLRYTPHFSRIGVFSDTTIFDSLINSPKRWDDYDKLY